MQDKKRAFIVFTDLDGTFKPMGLQDAKRFVDLMKEIKEKENVDVKFCPISGRPADFVMGELLTFKKYFEDAGLKNVAEYGSGEQGGVIVDSARAYKQVFIGNKQNVGIKSEILQALNNSKFKDIMADEPGKRFTCSLHIKEEYASKMTPEQKKAIYSDLKEELSSKLGKKVCVAMASDCVEAMPVEISKSEAIRRIVEHYQKKYDIAGITYSGDAENDKKAIEYVSKLAEIPGCKANVFIPGNANKCIESSEIEQWKERLKNVASDYRIEKGEQKYFAGVMDLMVKAMKSGRLVESPRKEKLETKDDFALLRVKRASKGLDLSM